MTHMLSRISAARQLVSGARARKPPPKEPTRAPSGRSAASSPAPGATAHAPASALHAATRRPSAGPGDNLDKPFSTSEKARIDRQLSTLRPDWNAWSDDGQRASLEDALKQSHIACYDIGRPGGTVRPSGPQFSASIHPTKANIENFVDQLYNSQTKSLVNLARPNEYGIIDPEYYNTNGETKTIGTYQVTGRQVGKPVPLGMNTPAHGETSQPITLRFYEMKIVPKADADNPAAAHTVRAFEVDHLTDGTAFEPGQLTKLAMQLLKAGSSSIHVHCFGGFDRTGMTIALSQFIQLMLDGKKTSDPVGVVKGLLDNIRSSRDEPTAVQGDCQLAALAGEATRLAAMPRNELKALFDAIPTLGVQAPAHAPRPRARPTW